MWDLKACTVCLSTGAGVKLFSLNSGKLRNEFNTVSGLKTRKGSGMPDHLCVECNAYVNKFVKFRQKCQRAHYTLEHLMSSKKEIKKVHLKSLNRAKIGVMPHLAFISLDRSHYEQHKFQWISMSLTNVTQFNHIPVIHHSTLTKEDTFESVMSGLEIDKSIKIEVPNDIDISEFEITPSEQETKPLPHVLTAPLVEEKYDIVKANDEDMDFANDYEASNDMDYPDQFESFGDFMCKLDSGVDGSAFDEEYAKMVPISVKEAKAVVEVKKSCMAGQFKCNVCTRAYKREENLNLHIRMHDKHSKGTFHCKLCDYYYKTQFLLQTHMTEKHMYKYLCRMCSEVSFDRTTAKNHYCNSHLQKQNKGTRWNSIPRPSWLLQPKKTTGTGRKRKRAQKIPDNVFTFKPITHEEQYSMIQARRLGRNYLEAKFKCDQCFRGYRLMSTYSNHMAKHNPSISGNLQCDMCKLYFRDQRKMYKHMSMYHLKQYSCKNCDFVSTNRAQAVAHYRWHNNVKYDCPHCFKTFSKASTQLTHIRLKHPSGTCICHLCGHSFVSAAGLACHKQMSHAHEDTNEPACVDRDTNPNYCADCNILFASDRAFTTHLGSSSKHVNTNISVFKYQRESRSEMRREMREAGRGAGGGAGGGAAREKRPRNGTSEVLNTGATTSNNCEVCGKYLSNDVQARKHYEAEHPGSDYLRRYMCEICGHTARQYANLIVHMRTHTNEKPYGCPHCDRRFSMLSNRDRHLVVHTGEKKYQCHHCSRRFTQSSAVKLHIQTVHLKIPYAPWDKKNRKRRKELEAAGVPGIASATDCTPVEIAPVACIIPQPQHKLVLDTQGEYINAYITYSDE